MLPHEKLILYQKAVTFGGIIYGLCKTNKYITNDRNIKSQIQRASISISSNIAEGASRGSKKEFIRFLYIARGSMSEVISILSVCKEIGYINNDEISHILIYSEELCKLINGLIKRLLIPIS